MAPRNLPASLLTHDNVEARLLSPIKESTGQDGNPEGCTVPSDIPWFDATLAERGRRFVESNFFVVLMLNFVNTFMGLANKPIAVLSFEVFTKGGRGCVGPRYVSTVKSMMSWFLSEKYDEDSDIFREVERVRKLHRLYARPATLPEVPHPGLELGEGYEEFARVVRKDLDKIDTSLCPTSLKGCGPPLLFTQFELAFVVYASVYSLFLFLEKLGLSGDSETDGISGYIHLWAVAGRMLGLKDEFNVALNPDREFYLKIMQHLGFGTFTVA
ncbi:hypothetical protein Fcan01_20095 [Folsomia candida]|uniref:ER-bound oxygenase mpaB/mpaB'/Rubber oxygenase catalytic domain-containing protein n=1 Tax=Folsomia candida TaxID=158441 RepID=A0A226DL02_FOLCA|nr:hypothetical protein Fcan01_20095 [Folsomia candida]